LTGTPVSPGIALKTVWYPQLLSQTAGDFSCCFAAGLVTVWHDDKTSKMCRDVRFLVL
jgi:hypothetical protein